MLADLAVSDCVLSLLQASVSVFWGDKFSLGGILAWRAMAQDELQGSERNWKDPWFLCPGGSGGSLLGQEFDQK